MAQVACQNCNKEFSVVPARVGTAKFCSYACRGQWRSKHWLGDKHPNWQGGERTKICERCGKPFGVKGTVATFRKTRFCSRKCGWLGQHFNRGPDHPNYKADARRRSRSSRQRWWSTAVISRDLATCQRCGAKGVPLDAHHIKAYKDAPELRWEIDNGTTLCSICHWQAHTALVANGVNSGDTLPGQAGGNPEPSFGRKPVEGVTVRGRAYRRWHGPCAWCGRFLSKQWSDVKNKQNVFCSLSCAGKLNARLRMRSRR